MKSILTIYFATLKVLIVSSLVCITLLIFSNVVLRYGFNSGLFFSEEISRLAFVWLVFAGAQLMLHENGHIGVDIVTSRVSPTVGKYLLLLTQVLMLYVTWLFLEGSWKHAVRHEPVRGAEYSQQGQLHGCDLRRITLLLRTVVTYRVIDCIPAAGPVAATVRLITW